MLVTSDLLERLHTAAFTTNLLEAFVDDFCAMTKNLSRSHLTKFSCALIIRIHTIFLSP